MHKSSTESISSPVPVSLSNGGFALVDAIDAPRVLARKWTRWTAAPGHVYAKSTKAPETMHRFLLGLEPGDPRVGDHVDGDGLNNRRANLRICTKAENTRNRRRVNSRSGYKGVFHENRGFTVRIGGRNAERSYEGFFHSKHVAALVYNEAAKRKFGAFAALNVIDADACRADLLSLMKDALKEVASIEAMLAALDAQKVNR